LAELTIWDDQPVFLPCRRYFDTGLFRDLASSEGTTAAAAIIMGIAVIVLDLILLISDILFKH
jgi:hypothetical protein